MMHHLLRALILTGFALMIVYLFRTGEITLYIAPRMELYVKLSAIGLYAAAVYQIYAALQKRSAKQVRNCECECSHEPSPSKVKNVIIYGLFVFPLLLVFLLPTGTLGSVMAAKKGVSFTGSESINRVENPPSIQTIETETDLDPSAVDSSEASNDSEASLDRLFPADSYTQDLAAYGKRLYPLPLIDIPEDLFIETLTTLDLYRDAFVGKEIRISGFVYREEEMGTDRLAVSRFAVNCCSADALPYGLMIAWPKAKDYAADEWISVTGKLTTSLYMDNEIITLEVSRIERIAPPESPYVYPNFDFGL